MLNITTMMRDSSERKVKEPKTGEVMRTKVTLMELLDSHADRREYRVLETVGVVILREEVFACAGYMDLDSDADTRARELARDWIFDDGVQSHLHFSNG